MQDATKQKQLYKVLAVVFAIAGLAWIIGGIFSVYHRILYPFIGVANWAVAWYCWQMSK